MVGFASKETAKGWLWAIVIGSLALWQFHIPQFSSHFDKFPGDRGDARLVAFLMEHWNQVFHGAANWQSPGIFFPVQGTLGYADLLLAYGIVHSILRTLGLGIFEAAEFTMILFNFLNYLVCFILLQKVLQFNLIASIAGAVFFAFNNPKLVQLGHPQLQPILFLPLAMIAIVLFVQHRDKLSQLQGFGLIALAMLSLNIQLLTGFYSAWFFIFWSGLFLFVSLLFTQTRKVIWKQMLKFWPAILGGVVVFGVGLIPFLKAYWPVLKSIGGRNYNQVYALIPLPWSFLLTSQRNYVWGTVSKSIVDRTQGMNPELVIGIGLVPTLTWIALVVFAIWFMIVNLKKSSRIAPERQTNLYFLSTLIIATSLVYLLGLKYWHGFSPWQYVSSWVPGAQAIRAVCRYALITALPMAIAFAWLIDHLSKRIAQQEIRTRRALLMVLLLLVTTFGLVEQFGSKEGFNGFSISAENQYLSELAQELHADCSSFYVTVKPDAPHNTFEYQIDAALVSAIKGVPTLNGYSGALPPTWDLWEVKAGANYENNVKAWIASHHLTPNVCRLAINEPTAPTLVDIAKPEVFVRQQYLDILQREPDPTGLQTWLTKLKECPEQGGLGGNSNCDRVYVQMGLLGSAEFSERSYFVLRLYLATIGRRPLYEEFVRDHAPIGIVESGELKRRKEQLIVEWVQRPEFKSIYDDLTNASFVDKLLHTAANSSANRRELLAQLDSQQKTRAQVVEAVVEDQQTIEAFRNQAFVLMQFFANLNRDPKEREYDERLKMLNATGNYRQLVFDFIYSVEYRKRFGYLN